MFIDDIIIFNRILKKYLKYLTIVFVLFYRLRITLKLFKIYIDYFFVILLNQYITIFDFIIVIEKLKTLKNLKHYSNLID